MNDAPERVWKVGLLWYYHRPHKNNSRRMTEYVRADIHRREMVAFDQLEAEVARLREALEPTVRRLEQVLAGQPVRDADEVILAARRALEGA